MALDLVDYIPSGYTVISAIVVYIGVPILTIIFVSLSIFVVFTEIAESIIGFVSTISFVCIVLSITFAAHWALDTIPLLILDGAIVLILCYKALLEKVQTIRQDQRLKQAEEVRKQERCAKVIDRTPLALLQAKLRVRKRRERKLEEDLQKLARGDETRKRPDALQGKDLMYLRTAESRMQWPQEEVVEEVPLEEIHLEEAGIDDDPRSTEEILMECRSFFNKLTSFTEPTIEVEEPQVEASDVGVRVDKMADTNWRHPVLEDISEDEIY